MTPPSDLSFNSRDEMLAVVQKYNKVSKVLICIGAGTALCSTLFETISILCFDKRPISYLLQAHFWPTAIGAVVILFFLGQTEFAEREVSKVARAYRLVREYERASSELENGLGKGKAKSVLNGIDRLERLEPSCAKMPEYQEQLSRGRSWLAIQDPSKH